MAKKTKASSSLSLSRTSIASSTVTIPTMRISLSTTGIAIKPYLLIMLAASSWSSRVCAMTMFSSIISEMRVSPSARSKSFAVTIPRRIGFLSVT